MSYTPEVENAATEWLAKHRATDDPKVVAMIVQRAQELCAELGGYFSVAHCERAYLELCSEKRIRPFKGSMEDKIESESAAIPQEVVDFIERSSAFELQRKYKTDPTFRAQYDIYLKRPKQAESTTLTAEQYRAMPSSQLQQKLRDPQFKLQVMQLIKAGLITLVLALITVSGVLV